MTHVSFRYTLYACNQLPLHSNVYKIPEITVIASVCCVGELCLAFSFKMNPSVQAVQRVLKFPGHHHHHHNLFTFHKSKFTRNKGIELVT
jgi:hypothetical protein